MDSPFSPENYFDLSSYAHRRLFDEVQNVWEALHHLEKYLQDYQLTESVEQRGESFPGAWLINPSSIFLGEECIIEPGACIIGPCILGKRCTVRHGAYLRGNVVAGDGCVIGHTSEIKHSILLNDAHAAHFAYVGDSILGNRINLGAGTKLANVRLDRAVVSVRDLEGRYHSTGLSKCGAILGDGCQIGCNAVLNPGTLFGKDVACCPSINVGGIIPAHSIVQPVSPSIEIAPKSPISHKAS